MNGITIFTDGSSRGNPGSGGWAAIVRTKNSVTELGGRESPTTNNRMELTAVIEALEYAKTQPEKNLMTVLSDSKYVIQGITSWVLGWQKNGWKTAGKKDVVNRDLWERLYAISRSLSLVWKYVEGHAGHPGNERCDEIATSYADGVDPHLYKGPVEKYAIDLDAPAASIPKKKGSSNKRAAYSYLSLVDGILEIHKTWVECEKRVKGKKGARFKKSSSKEDEASIIKEWGV